MKTWVTIVVAASLLGAMGVAQAGVPTHVPTPSVSAVSKAHTPHAATRPATASAARRPAAQPQVAGTLQAQHSATSSAKKMAIIAGVVLAAVLVVAAASGGGSSNPTSSGTSGTTGTH